MLPAAVAVLLALLTLHPYPYDNVVTRWAAVRSLCDRGTLEIDRYASLTSDRAVHGGHSYPDKAILLSLAAVPVCLSAGVAGAGEPERPEDLLDDPARYLAERLLIGGSLLLVLLLVKAGTGGGAPGSLAVAAVGLGSIVLPYSSLLYAHVPAAAMLLASHHLQRRGRLAAADAAGCAACALEFPAAVPFAILLLYRPRGSWRGVRPFLRLAGFAAAALLPQLAFNAAAFGDPFRMGYSLEGSPAFEGMSSGFFGFSAPDPRALYLITLSPERGLFFYMPWAAAALAGSFTGRGLRETLREDPAPLLVVSYALLFSGYYMASGGWSFGPRHLIPVIPFLAPGLARFAAAGPRRHGAAWILVLPAMVQALTGLLGEVHQPVHPVEQPVPLPQLRIGIEMMLAGHHSVWLGGIAGTLVLTGAAFLSWALCARGARFSPASAAALALWAGMMLTSPGGWASRTAYYRGVLAEHRGEYALAAGWYSEAASDPSAPGLVRQRADRCRRLAEQTVD